VSKATARSKKNLTFFLLGFAFLLAPIFGMNMHQIGLLILMLVNVGMAVSVRMVLVTGQFHVCHAAFMGIGAYTSALLVNYVKLSFWLALPASAGITALSGLIIGYITLRLKGLYFFFVTFCLAEVFRLGIVNGPKILGGFTGISTSPVSPIIIPGLLTIDFTSRIYSYYFIFFVTALVVVVAHRIDSTRYGNILKGIAQNDALLESLGVDIAHYKILVFTVTCTIAGVIGSFWAHYFLVVAVDDYNTWKSIYFVVYNQVGGLGSVAGPILGAISLTVLHELLRPTIQFEPIIFGAILVGFIILLPGGLSTLKQPILSLAKEVFIKRKRS